MKNASVLVHFGNLHADALGRGILRNPTIAFGKLDPRPVRTIPETISSAFLRAVRQDSAHAFDCLRQPKAQQSLLPMGLCPWRGQGPPHPRTKMTHPRPTANVRRSLGRPTISEWEFSWLSYYKSFANLTKRTKCK